MPEVNRVVSTIKAFFDSSGKEQLENLGRVLSRCVMLASSRVMSRPEYTDNKSLKEEIGQIDKDLNDLMESPPTEKAVLKEKFADIAMRAMIARRALYPLENPDRPWDPPTAEEALQDDDDPYTFTIYEAIADDIAELLPSLYRLAVEGDWK